MLFKHRQSIFSYENFLDITDKLTETLNERRTKGTITEGTYNKMIDAIEWLKRDQGYPKRIDHREKER